MTKVTRQDFELEVSPMEETLEQVKATLRQHFEIRDWQGVEIILAVAAAHYLPGEMLWVRIIGASRSGKTELLRAIAEHSDCAEMEAITPAALRGGFKQAPKLLERINGKLVIDKDIASILTARKEIRTEIFGLLRGIKDGKITSDFGSDEGYLPQKAKFDWLLASTSYIEQQRSLEGLLGERFLDLRWRPGDREEMAFRAAMNNPYLENIRSELALDVLSLLYRAKELAETETYTLPEDEVRVVAKIADSVAIARTPVQQDRSGHLIAMPDAEVGTELAQGLSRISAGLRLLGLADFEPYIRRLAWDCIPSIRAKLLQSLHTKPQTVPELVKSTEIPERTVYYHIEQLELLKVVKDKNGIKEIAIALP
jgi:hypothetical protein